ncbi:hypothetical protein [Amycolatopsis sp. cmx-4-68]|uniref:hypothetical protein n=1 Tax=Amycolatopsis sp. cmx-4-68 TaxID=2790938 RepID=UPI00397D5B93
MEPNFSHPEDDYSPEYFARCERLIDKIRFRLAVQFREAPAGTPRPAGIANCPRFEFSEVPDSPGDIPECK